MEVKGKEVDIDRFGKNNILQDLKKLSQNILLGDGETFELELLFSNESEFNAVAYLENEKAVSNISISTVIDIYHHSLIMMKRNDFFDVLGKEKNLDNPFEIWEFEYPQVTELDTGYRQINFYEGPEAELKRNAAYLMTWFGMEFLIFHEIGHHLGGHIKYIRESLGVQALFANDQSSVIEAKQYQLLEMDADAIAVNLLLEDLYVKFHYYLKYISDATLLPQLLLSALTTVFFLIKKDFVEQFDQDSNKYLPRDFRFYLVVNIILNKFNREYKACKYNQSNEMFIGVIQKTNMLLQELYCNEDDWQGIELNNLRDIGNYYEKILLSEWQPLRNKLMKYSKIKLPE